MGAFTFEGEVSALEEKQQELVVSVFEEKGFKNAKIEIHALGKPGDNYVANVKRIVAEEDGKKLSIVAKVAPTQEVVRQSINTALCFSNETIMYTEVLPKFAQMEKEANIPEKDRLKYAKCYASYLEAPYEIILLEDLCDSDFKMLNRFVSLNNESIKLILKDFAKLHCLSYVLKNTEPETFAAYSKKLINIWYLLSHVPNMEMFMTELCNDVINLLEEEKYSSKVNSVISGMMKEASILGKEDRGSKHSVIQQGDPWTNNILFRLAGEKSVECCMIDYQISKESSPIADIYYMIFNCTDYATRSKHYNDWIEYYLSELDKRLNIFGLKREEVYPRSQFEADLKRYSKFTLAQSIMLASMLIRESKDAAVFKEAVNQNKTMEEVMEACKLQHLDEATKKRFKTRVEELIDSFVELGYLKW